MSEAATRMPVPSQIVERAPRRPVSQHGYGLGPVGLVLSAHTLGMFALSPVSGRLTGRLGALSTIWLGTGILVAASLMAAVAPPTAGLLLGVALFLLGFGWNLGFVAGSSLLTSGLDVAERTRVQGLADGLIWTTAALASVGSGLVLQAAGFTTLGLLGAVVVLLPVWLFLTRRGAILAVAGAGRASS
jgi:MFS family permease